MFAIVTVFLSFALFHSIPPGYWLSPSHGLSSKLKKEEWPKMKPIEKPVESKLVDQLVRVVVVARLSSEDVSWLHEELPDVPTAVYTVDDPTAPLHPPKNKGREAMVYLSYLIDHYDNLPDEMIFLHYHRWAWHNNDLLDLDAVQAITALSSPYVQRRGYVNLRCHWKPGCPDWMHPLDPTIYANGFKQEELELDATFRELFPSHPVPETLAQPCCAQFALTRSFAQNITRQRYVEIRNWLLDTPLDDMVSGRVLEFLWQYLFTNEAVVCPRTDICYCDGFGICFGGESQLTTWLNLRDKQRKLQRVLKILEEGEDEDGDEQEIGGPTQNITDEVRENIEKIKDELDTKLREAKRRGEDPRNRAFDSGRAWKEGDGF